VSEKLLDDVIQLNGLAAACATGKERALPESRQLRFVGLVPCAHRMLVEGVTNDQRVSCFHIAVQLKKAGVPLDITIAALRQWARKNQPTDGKRTLTETEIQDQARHAFSGNYQGCGCEQAPVARYCDAGCPVCGGKDRQRTETV
jgi:hypothetical protein